MSETNVSRRAHGEDGIYLDAARNRYMGEVSLGYGPGGKRIRRKVSGKTKQELQALHQEVNAGVKSSSTYTVRQTVDDWLREGLDGTSERTRALCEGLLGPLLEIIGARPLRTLSAGDVRSGLGKLSTRYSTRSLQITRNSLERAIRHAECDDLVERNVAALVKAPRGRSGRPSKSFMLAEAKALLAASEQTRLGAYVVLSLLAGIRTEEARALRWDHVVTCVDDAAGWQPVTSSDFDPSRAGERRFALYVWRWPLSVSGRGWGGGRRSAMLTGSEPTGLRVARTRAGSSSLGRRSRTVQPLPPVTATVRPLSCPAGAAGTGPPWPGCCACLQARCIRALPGGLVDVSSAGGPDGTFRLRLDWVRRA